MIKHFNKITKKYRYKGYDFKTKEFKEINFFVKDMGHIFDGYCKSSIKCYFIKHNYKPYFLFRLFWFFKSFKYQKPNNKFNPQSRKHTTVVFLMIVGIIISIIIGWDNIVLFFN